jgi:hypothetical protein
MNINEAMFYRVTTGRTDLEIDQDISSKVESIQAAVKKRLGWGNMMIPYSKKLLVSVIMEPVKFFLKTCLSVGVGYVVYLLTRGIFAGIEVDDDSNFLNLFSSNKTVRLNEGLNLTNGDQAGQFMVDTVALAYIAGKLVFQGPYNKLAGEIINDCYKTALIESLSSLGDIEENASPSDYKLIKCKEEVNRIYMRLKDDLKPYGEEPIFYQKIIFIPSGKTEVENK